MPAGSFFLQTLVPDAGLSREVPPISERVQTREAHLLAQRLEVEVIKTGKSELLLDVDSLLQRGGSLEECVEEAKAGKLEGAAVVAAQHPWFLVGLIQTVGKSMLDTRGIALTHYELEADRLSEPEPEHRDGVSNHPVPRRQGAHAGENLKRDALDFFKDKAPVVRAPLTC